MKISLIRQFTYQGIIVRLISGSFKIAHEVQSCLNWCIEPKILRKLGKKILSIFNSIFPLLVHHVGTAVGTAEHIISILTILIIRTKAHKKGFDEGKNPKGSNLDHVLNQAPLLTSFRPCFGSLRSCNLREQP